MVILAGIYQLKMKQSITNHYIKKVNTNGVFTDGDRLATEEPLEVKLQINTSPTLATKSVSITMRTPGNDAELAIGFLFTEGIINDYSHVKSIAHVPYSDDNIIKIQLDENININIGKLERHFYTTSSCGVCGKASIDAIKTVCNISPIERNLKVSPEIIYTLPDTLRKQQEVFESTGGLHASAIFDIDGNLLMLREDVGRHNALDKLVGASLEKGLLPLDNHLLLLSGRASFELIQKAAMAGIKVVCAVGAPSSLAVETAEEMGMTLVGFLRGERFNIYTGEQRIEL